MEKKTSEISSHINKISGEIIDAAIQVHKAMGPGLLENVYEACLAHELREKGLKTEQQISVPVVYKKVQLEVGFRMDLLVEKLVIVELKAVERLLPIHEAQVLTYLKLTGHRVGLLLNFNEVLMKRGIKRIVL